VFFLLQQPIVVDVVKQPEVTQDISVHVVLGMFALAGVMLLAAAIGGLIVGGIFVFIRRLQDASRPPTDTEHVRLRI
jgi:hypothetical protein